MRKKTGIDLNTIVAKNMELISSDLDGETVMMSVENGKYYGLNNIGSRIWALIERPCLVTDLRNSLISEFDVESEKCEQDLISFLDDLLQKGVIEILDERYS